MMTPKSPKVVIGSTSLLRYRSIYLFPEQLQKLSLEVEPCLLMRLDVIGLIEPSSLMVKKLSLPAGLKMPRRIRLAPIDGSRAQKFRSSTHAIDSRHV
jgi:hypothetical protein